MRRFRYTCFSNGKPCGCSQLFSDNPSEYVAKHPNRRDPEGGTFNDEIAASVKTRGREELHDAH